MATLAPAGSVQVALAPKPVAQRLDNLALPVPPVFATLAIYTSSRQSAGPHVPGPRPVPARVRAGGLPLVRAESRPGRAPAMAYRARRCDVARQECAVGHQNPPGRG